jgi:hypothetical protein
VATALVVADPLAGLIIAGLTLREARWARRGERCCDDDAWFRLSRRLPIGAGSNAANVA